MRIGLNGDSDGNDERWYACGVDVKQIPCVEICTD